MCPPTSLKSPVLFHFKMRRTLTSNPISHKITACKGERNEREEEKRYIEDGERKREPERKDKEVEKDKKK